MILVLCGFVLALVFSLLSQLSWRKILKLKVPILGETNETRLESIRSMKKHHPVASSLSTLIELDGAGSWPPKANHENWPAALRPYRQIYLEMAPSLPSANPSLDDEVNRELRERFRTKMRQLLSERVNIIQVENIMKSFQAGDLSSFPRDAYNGFYCCIAVSRHMYRWATIPVVKQAQNEKILDFPPELDAPWPYLQETFGVSAESGNNTANVVHNFNEKGERQYKINIGMSDLIQSSEDSFFRMFYDLEVLAFPVYFEMTKAIVTFDAGDKAACRTHLRNLADKVRHLVRVFYDNLTERRVSREVWLSYIQGFQGWGVGRMVDGEFVKFDGLSGNHVLVFQAIDAFLGMDRYLTDENMDRYIPANQRDLCLILKKFSFRKRLEEGQDPELAEEIQKTVNHIRVFRAAHRTRVMPYLEQPAPERVPMTAGKSVLVGDTIKAALSVLDLMLVKRLKETV